MNYALIRNNDIANGEGVRVSLFVSGCDFHCPGCFNPEAQDYDYGEELTENVVKELLDIVKGSTISGLSILGGDPLCQEPYGLELLTSICKKVHKMGKTVWLWTGYVWEDIVSPSVPNKALEFRLIDQCDVVIDGPFKQELADRKLVWRGSENQRVIDVQASLRAGHVVEYRK